MLVARVEFVVLVVWVVVLRVDVLVLLVDFFAVVVFCVIADALRVIFFIISLKRRSVFGRVLFFVMVSRKLFSVSG